jgi:hypothetical protein
MKENLQSKATRVDRIFYKKIKTMPQEAFAIIKKVILVFSP